MGNFCDTISGLPQKCIAGIPVKMVSSLLWDNIVLTPSGGVAAKNRNIYTVILIPTSSYWHWPLSLMIVMILIIASGSFSEMKTTTSKVTIPVCLCVAISNKVPLNCYVLSLYFVYFFADAYVLA